MLTLCKDELIDLCNKARKELDEIKDRNEIEHMKYSNNISDIERELKSCVNNLENELCKKIATGFKS
jgi:sugar-specific transcriptional regulator TrmB